MKKFIFTICFLFPLSAFSNLINVSVNHDSLISSLLNKETNEFIYHQELLLDEDALPFINNRLEDYYNQIKEKLPEETALILLGDSVLLFKSLVFVKSGSALCIGLRLMGSEGFLDSL